MYWEPTKYVAKLRALKTDRNPLLLKCNMGAGHGGASGRYDRLKETAFEYAWLMSQVGIRPGPTPTPAQRVEEGKKGNNRRR
jgi:oligopeptidase B